MLTPPASYTTTNTNYYTNLPTTSASRNLTAEDLLIESLGGIDNAENRRWAQELLARYDFPPSSLHSPLEFARHYIQWEQTPLWAERHEIPPIETRVLDKTGNYHTLCYFANHTINAGCDAKVYQDHMKNMTVNVTVISLMIVILNQLKNRSHFFVITMVKTPPKFITMMSRIYLSG